MYIFSNYIYNLDINIVSKIIKMYFYSFWKNHIYAENKSIILGHIYNIDIDIIPKIIKIRFYSFEKATTMLKI